MYPKYFTYQPLVPMRAQASDAAEMVSQLLFGDVVELLGRDRQWLQISPCDYNYTGWIDEKAVLPIDEAWLSEVLAWEYVLLDQCLLHTRQAGATLPSRLSLGMRMPRLRAEHPLKIGSWSVDGVACETAITVPGGAAAVTSLSQRYLGVPYLWGGKSIAGIDCSGLTQIVYAMAGIQLPRNAREQAELGTEISFEHRKEGDLAFFKNDNGKVNHVGIILADGNIRHASGHVHDARLTEDGIVGKYTGQQTHRLCSIKRII